MVADIQDLETEPSKTETSELNIAQGNDGVDTSAAVKCDMLPDADSQNGRTAGS
jgi:hypothetical protein